MQFWKRLGAHLAARVHSQRGFDIKALRKSFKTEARRAFDFLLTDYGFNEPVEDVDGWVFSNGSLGVIVEQDCIRDVVVFIGIVEEPLCVPLAAIVERFGGNVVTKFPDPPLNDRRIARDLEQWTSSFSVEFRPRDADLGEMARLWPGHGMQPLILPGFLHNESRMREYLPQWALVFRAFAHKILKGEAPAIGRTTPAEALMNKILQCKNERERVRLWEKWDKHWTGRVHSRGTKKDDNGPGSSSAGFGNDWTVL